jgi:hypothetical protein
VEGPSSYAPDDGQNHVSKFQDYDGDGEVMATSDGVKNNKKFEGIAPQHCYLMNPPHLSK